MIPVDARRVDMYYSPREETADEAIERNKSMYVKGWISLRSLECRVSWILDPDARLSIGLRV